MTALLLILCLAVMAAPATAEPPTWGPNHVQLSVSEVGLSSANINISGDAAAYPICQLVIRTGNHAEAGEIVQMIDCTDWTGGARSYPLTGLSPDSSYTVTFNTAGAFPWSDFITAAPASARADVSLRIPNYGLKERRAIVQLSGARGDETSCEIQIGAGHLTGAVARSAPALQTLSCDDWTGGPRDYVISGLKPGRPYSASVTVSGPRTFSASSKSFTTPTPARNCKTAGSCGSSQPKTKISLAVACSRHQLPRKARHCSISSNAVARITATHATKFKLCVNYPHALDSTGYGQWREACTSWLHLKAKTPMVISLRKTFPVAYRWPRLGLTFADETIIARAPRIGPAAAQKVRFHTGR